ncbi:Transcription elongation factor SPT4 [Perkinsus olseni]|uniref:Transcription elongation factor SPT4 n=1 Tax=Perkinsus olseni TaxID=32597 RepID=A0A7J6MDM3_PEROL|nr:Transcription elongation factor SPT4 [Perkinsus olseni]KAF4669496.1 Transcription elongation factor SPT4 [Perkinsus olseni]
MSLIIHSETHRRGGLLCLVLLMGAFLTLLAVCRRYAWFDRSIIDGRAKAWKERWRIGGDAFEVASQDDTPWWSDLAVFLVGLFLFAWSCRIAAVSETLRRTQYAVPPEVIGNPIDDDSIHDDYYKQKMKPSWSSNQSLVAFWLLVVMVVSQSLTLPCLARFLPPGLTLHFLFLLACCWIWFRSYSGCCSGAVPVLCAFVVWLALSVIPAVPSPRNLCIAVLAAGSIGVIALMHLMALSVCCSGPLPADYTLPALAVSAFIILGLAAITFYSYNQISPLQLALTGDYGLWVQIEVGCTVAVNGLIVLAFLIALLRAPSWAPPDAPPSKMVNIEMEGMSPDPDWPSQVEASSVE